MVSLLGENSSAFAVTDCTIAESDSTIAEPDSTSDSLKADQ